MGVTIEKPTVLNLLRTIPSGIGLDIAKNHTGIVIWNGETTEEYGFELDPYDKDSYFAEYKMRRDFKNRLSSIVSGRHFEFSIVEDVYGGRNFDTTRKLLALNTVFDELLFDRVCTTGEFVRWGESKWMSNFRMLYKQKGKLKVKLETQAILEHLEYAYVLDNKNTKVPYYEDICDACGMLLGVVAAHHMKDTLAKSRPIHMSEVKLLYVEDVYAIDNLRDKRVQEEGYVLVDIAGRNIEKEILSLVRARPDDVLCAFVAPDKLGEFGIKHKFTFYESNEGYLLFYKK